jgi:hypothetical protein
MTSSCDDLLIASTGCPRSSRAKTTACASTVITVITTAWTLWGIVPIVAITTRVDCSRSCLFHLVSFRRLAMMNCLISCNKCSILLMRCRRICRSVRGNVAELTLRVRRFGMRTVSTCYQGCYVLLRNNKTYYTTVLKVCLLY